MSDSSHTGRALLLVWQQIIGEDLADIRIARQRLRTATTADGREHWMRHVALRDGTDDGWEAHFPVDHIDLPKPAMLHLDAHAANTVLYVHLRIPAYPELPDDTTHALKTALASRLEPAVSTICEHLVDDRATLIRQSTDDVMTDILTRLGRIGDCVTWTPIQT